MEKYADPKELIGNVDFPSIWYQGPRKGMQLHWDGNNTSVDERNLSAAFGTGAYPPTLDVDRVLRTAKTDWRPAKRSTHLYQTPVGPLAVQGKQIYQEYCARCHGTQEPPFRHNPPQPDELVGTVVPIEKIGTDRCAWTPIRGSWPLTAEHSLRRLWGRTGASRRLIPSASHFQQSRLRAMPILPSMESGCARRICTMDRFRISWDTASSPRRTGSGCYCKWRRRLRSQTARFVSSIAEQDGHKFFPFDARQPGDGNGGHTGAAYGTDLPDDEKWALLEYLKTF